MSTDSGRNWKQSDGLSIPRNYHDNINIKAKSNIRDSFVGNSHELIFCELGAVETIIRTKQDPVSVDNLGTVRVFDKNQVRIVDFEKAKRRNQISSVLFEINIMNILKLFIARYLYQQIVQFLDC